MQNKGLCVENGAEKRFYWLASCHSGRTELSLASVLTEEQNKGLYVDSGAEKRRYIWLASRHSVRTEMPLAGGLAVEILLASEPIGQSRDAIGW